MFDPLSYTKANPMDDVLITKAYIQQQNMWINLHIILASPSIKFKLFVPLMGIYQLYADASAYATV